MNHTSIADKSYCGEILEQYELAASLDSNLAFTFNTPTIEVIVPNLLNGEDGDSVIYNNFSYKLNFYNMNKNLLFLTDISYDNEFTLTTSEWNTILNGGNYFYISVTTYENNGIVTSYETKLYEYQKPIVYYIDCWRTYSITIDDFKWYEFTSVQTASYVFETSGSSDTVGYLYSAIDCNNQMIDLITWDDNSGTDDNFKITYTINAYQKVYLKIKLNDGDSFTFSIYQENHVHSYNYSYESVNSSNHSSYCNCGEYITESHQFITSGIGLRCRKCGYFTTSPIYINSTIIIPTIDEEEEE